MIALAWREILPTALVNELDQLVAGIRSYLFTEHTQEGSHADVIADSVTVRPGGSVRVLLPEGAASAGIDPRLELVVDPDDPTNVLLRVPSSLELNPANELGYMKWGRLGIAGIDMTRWGGWLVRPAGTEQSPTSPGPQWQIVSGVDGLSAILGIGDATATPWKFRYVSGIGYVLTPGSGAKADVGVSLGTKSSTSSERFTEVAADSVYGHNGFFRSARTVAEGEWQAYTPTLISTGTDPSGYAATGRYTVIGKTVHFWAEVIATSAWADGTGAYQISLPLTAAASRRVTGTVFANEIGVAVHLGQLADDSTTHAFAYWPNGGGSGAQATIMAPGVPFSIADNDIIRFHGTYEIA